MGGTGITLLSQAIIDYAYEPRVRGIFRAISRYIKIQYITTSGNDCLKLLETVYYKTDLDSFPSVFWGLNRIALVKNKYI